MNYEDEGQGIFPFICPRCKSCLGLFELSAFILERAQRVGENYICYTCLTPDEKVKFLEEYIVFREGIEWKKN